MSDIPYLPIHKEQSFLFPFLTCGLARKKKYKFCLHVMRLSVRALDLELAALRFFLLRVQALACGLALFYYLRPHTFLFLKNAKSLRPHALAALCA